MVSSEFSHKQITDLFADSILRDLSRGRNKFLTRIERKTIVQKAQTKVTADAISKEEEEAIAKGAFVCASFLQSLFVSLQRSLSR